MALPTVDSDDQDAFLYWIYLLLREKHGWPRFRELDDVMYRKGAILRPGFDVWKGMPSGLVRPPAPTNEAMGESTEMALTVAGARWVLDEHGRTGAAARFEKAFLACIERALYLDRHSPEEPLTHGDGIDALARAGASVDELRLLGFVLACEPLGFKSIELPGVAAEWSMIPGHGIRKFAGVASGTIGDLDSYWDARTEFLEQPNAGSIRPGGRDEVATAPTASATANHLADSTAGGGPTAQRTESHVTDRPKVFLGSSTAGVDIANNLKVALERSHNCEATVWHEGVFEPGGITLLSLEKQASAADFAILVATADDTLTSADGSTSLAARDNVIFELGLFIGALGSNRVYIVTDNSKQQLRLPSDLAGVTWVPYQGRSDGNVAAAVGTPATQIGTQIKKLGLGPRTGGGAPPPSPGPSPPDELTAMFGSVVEHLRANAEAQGWGVRQTPTVMKFRHPRNRRLKFALMTSSPDAEDPPARLRNLVLDLRGAGLRVSQSVTAVAYRRA